MFTRFRDCQKFQIVKPDIDLSHYAVTSQLGRERNAEVRVAPVTSPKLVVDDQYRTRACLCACARARVCVLHGRLVVRAVEKRVHEVAGTIITTIMESEAVSLLTRLAKNVQLRITTELVSLLNIHVSKESDFSKSWLTLCVRILRFARKESTSARWSCLRRPSKLAGLALAPHLTV